MKRSYTLLVLAIVGVIAVPSLAFASWWNPITWFQSPSAESVFQSPSTGSVMPVEQVPQQVQPAVVAEPTTTPPSNPIIVASTTPVQSIIQSSVDGSVMQSKIVALTSEASSLKSQIASLKSQLATTQNNYSICQTSLTAASTIQNAPVQTQTPPLTPAPVPTNNSSDQALYNLDVTSPQAQTENTSLNNLTALIFDITPPASGSSYIHSLTVSVDTSGQGDISTVYLYQGSTQIASALVNNGSATFSHFTTLVSPIGPSILYSVKTNVNLSTGTAESFSVSVTSLEISDWQGHIVNANGSADGNIITATDLSSS